MADFKPALSLPIKWSVGENQFDDNGKFPKSLSLTIPVEIIPELCSHLMALEADSSKHKQGKVWNFKEHEEAKVDVIYLNGKGKEGEYGDFGNINPVKIEQELPF